MGWRSGAAGAGFSKCFRFGLHGRYFEKAAPAAPLRHHTHHTDYSQKKMGFEFYRRYWSYLLFIVYSVFRSHFSQQPTMSSSFLSSLNCSGVVF